MPLMYKEDHFPPKKKPQSLDLLPTGLGDSKNHRNSMFDLNIRVIVWVLLINGFCRGPRAYTNSVRISLR